LVNVFLFPGLPVLIVGATLVISLDKYKAATHCWLNVETDMIWAFVGPVLFVLGVRTLGTGGWGGWT